MSAPPFERGIYLCRISKTMNAMIRQCWRQPDSLIDWPPACHLADPQAIRPADTGKHTAIRRTAMTTASGNDQIPLGMLAIIRARLSAASPFGSVARRPASVHGSEPRRAKADRTLNVMPFASVPMSAKRNWFRSDRSKRGHVRRSHCIFQNRGRDPGPMCGCGGQYARLVAQNSHSRKDHLVAAVIDPGIASEGSRLVEDHRFIVVFAQIGVARS